MEKTRTSIKELRDKLAHTEAVLEAALVGRKQNGEERDEWRTKFYQQERTSAALFQQVERLRHELDVTTRRLEVAEGVASSTLSQLEGVILTGRSMLVATGIGPDSGETFARRVREQRHEAKQKARQDGTDTCKMATDR